MLTLQIRGLEGGYQELDTLTRQDDEENNEAQIYAYGSPRSIANSIYNEANKKKTRMKTDHLLETVQEMYRYMKDIGRWFMFHGINK